MWTVNCVQVRLDGWVVMRWCTTDIQVLSFFLQYPLCSFQHHLVKIVCHRPAMIFCYQNVLLHHRPPFLHVCNFGSMQDSKLLSNTCAEHIYNYSKTAATGPLPIERALKSDVVSILAIYQQQYSNHITRPRSWQPTTNY